VLVFDVVRSLPNAFILLKPTSAERRALSVIKWTMIDLWYREFKKMILLLQFGLRDFFCAMRCALCAKRA
jgi:hypothetical protein